MVLDNDEALRREGCDPTYQKVKGFQPLHLIWEGKIIDAIFRRGKRHSNYGQDVAKMIRGIVSLIRTLYDANVTIAKCQIRMRLPFILEMFTKLSSSVLTSLLYRTPPKTRRDSATPREHAVLSGRYLQFRPVVKYKLWVTLVSGLHLLHRITALSE
jgi:hypothetical protein